MHAKGQENIQSFYVAIAALYIQSLAVLILFIFQ